MMSAPTPWMPEDLRRVAQLLYGHGWQTALADAIAKTTHRNFPQSRVAKWYLPERPRTTIETWLQPHLTAILSRVATTVEISLQVARMIIDEH